MTNELFFVGFILIDMIATLLIFNKYGKTGLICFYVAHVILVQITIQMQINLFGYTTVVGSMLFAVLFVITDILTEHYDKKSGYQAVNLGVISLILFIIVIHVAQLFEPSASNTVTKPFSQLFSGQLRITLSDLLISYWIFQSFDVWLYHKIQEWTDGKMLWLRNIASTAISQTIIAVLFFQVAFAGIIEQSTLWEIIITGLLMKLFVALLDTPFIYASYKFIPNKNKVK